MQPNWKKGFTLVEVLTVVVIVIVVTLFAIPTYKKNQAKNAYLIASGVLMDIGNAVRMLREDYPSITASNVLVSSNTTGDIDTSVMPTTNDAVIRWMFASKYLNPIPFEDGKYKGYLFKFSLPNNVNCATGCPGTQDAIACMYNESNLFATCGWVDKSGNLHHN